MRPWPPSVAFFYVNVRPLRGLFLGQYGLDPRHRLQPFRHIGRGIDHGDRAAVREAMSTLRNAAGNVYVNDKPTGAVVGQQPFGGSRASGTDDKAGSKLNLLRWVSVRTIKETFVPPTEHRYPYMSES